MCDRKPTASLGNRELQERFAGILPRIRTHARIYFRGVRCPHKKADCVAETVGLAWKWFVRLAEVGKDATRFPSTLATFAARAVKSGRKVAGMIKAKDAMNENTQHKRCFTVESLPQTTRTDYATLHGAPFGQRRLDAWEERLQDNAVTPPDEQAAFRIDWRAWVKTHSRRDRRLLRDMGMGERTQELAVRYALSQARISQLRREFACDWKAFTADPNDQQ